MTTSAFADRRRPRHSPSLLQVGAILLAIAACPIAQAEEPTPWAARKGRNMVSSAENLPARLGDDNRLWSVRVRGWHFATPTILDGRVYLGGQTGSLQLDELKKDVPRNMGAFLCWDVTTGEPIWEHPGAKSPFGVVSSMVPDGDRLYATDGSGVLYCFDVAAMADGNDGPYRDEAADVPQGADLSRVGDVLWKRGIRDLYPKVLLDHGHAGTPLVIGDTVWVTTTHAVGNKQKSRPCGLYHSTHYNVPLEDRPVNVPMHQLYGNYVEDKDPADIPPLVLVFDKHTGELLATDDGKFDFTHHGNWSTLSAGRFGDEELVFYADGGGKLHAYAIPGREQLRKARESGRPAMIERRWKFDTIPHSYMYDEAGHPRAYMDGKKGANDILLPHELISTPVVHRGRVYVAIGRDYMYGFSKGMLYCLEPADDGGVRVRWKTDRVWTTMLNTAVADGLVYIADMPGRVHCIDADTGEHVWTQDISGGNKTNHSVYSSTWLADGKIYAGTHRRYFAILRAGREKELLHYDKLSYEPVTVATTDGVLVIPGRGGVSAYGPASAPEQLAQGGPEQFFADGPLRINCAAGKDYTDLDGNVWQADRIYVDSSFGKLTWGYIEGRAARRKPHEVADTRAPGIYLTERYGPEEYRIPVPDGPVRVRLHFAETFEGSQEPGNRFFNVALEGKTVLKRFDPFAAAEGRKFQPVTREFVVKVADGELTIDFTRHPDSKEPVLINAIEVEPVESSDSEAPGGDR
jgi:outer membrane protein assembly factor BamB